MLNRIGKQTLIFRNKPRVIGSYSVVGPKEGKGNFAKFFHKILEDDLFGEKSYEAAESKMLRVAITEAIANARVNKDEIDALFAGDLMNQIISSSFAARTLGVPYFGLFGACSTMAESLIMGACHVDGGFARYAACATGSHFSSAEKQFRYPLELGTQRPPSSQWTVTGMGCTILGNTNKGIAVESATIGKVVDWGVADVNNMGAAMAPAIAIIGLCGMILPRISNTKIYSKGGKYSINNVCEIQLGSQQNILLTFYYRIKIQII